MMMLEEEEKRTQDHMSQLRRFIVENDYNSLRSSLINGGLQVCMGLAANFALQMKTDGQGVRYPFLLPSRHLLPSALAAD